MVDLQVRLIQGLLHVLNMNCRQFNEALSMPAN
jgi:hypothetical protein